MKKPANVQDAKELVDRELAKMAKKRTEHQLAERAYLKAKEWLIELEGKLGK